MSLTSEQIQKLMAYADGELEGAERDEVEQLLATDHDAVRFVDQIAGLGELVQLGYDAKTAKKVAAFDVADAVMALAKDAGQAKEGSRSGAVVDLSDRRARQRSLAIKVGTGVAAALALAASIFVVARSGSQETPMATGPTAAAGATGREVSAQVAGQPGLAVAANGSGTGVEVSTVESAGNSVTVFYLPTANELSTSVVVWVDETGEK